MSQDRRSQLESGIIRDGLIPIFYQPDPTVVAELAAACEAGGAHQVEFTNRGAGAYRTFATARERLRDAGTDVALGVGSVMDPATAALYIGEGADFVVGPYLDPAVAALCLRLGVPYIPGAATPGEIGQAESRGATFVKVFPARVLGPEFVADVLGPSPRSRLIPTGGVEATEVTIAAWIRAGAVAVGIGTDLTPSHPRKPSDLSAVPGRVARVRGWIAAARVSRDTDADG